MVPCMVQHTLGKTPPFSTKVCCQKLVLWFPLDSMGKIQKKERKAKSTSVQQSCSPSLAQLQIQISWLHRNGCIEQGENVPISVSASWEAAFTTFSLAQDDCSPVSLTSFLSLYPNRFGASCHLTACCQQLQATGDP